MKTTKLDTAFSNGKWTIAVHTVGRLIDELTRLPQDMPVHGGSADFADLVVFNRGSEPFVELCDGGDWTGDE